MASLTLRKAVKAALEHFAEHADLLGRLLMKMLHLRKPSYQKMRRIGI